MKKVIKVALFTSLLTLTRMLSGFVIAKFVAIYTGPVGLATLGQLQSVVTLLNGVVNSPVGNGIVRYTAESLTKSENIAESCSSWWRASICWAFILCVSISIFIYFFNCNISVWLFGSSSYSKFISIASYLLPFSVLYTAINSVINGQQEYKKYVKFGIISVLISTFIMSMMIIFFAVDGALYAAVSQVAIMGIVMLVLVFASREPWMRVKYWFGRIGKHELRNIGSYVAMGLSSAIMVPITLVVIRNILVDNVGWIETGYWQAVWRISEVYLSVITLTLSTYYLPKLSTLNAYSEIKKEITNTAILVMPIVIILAVFVYLLRDFIIYVLFSSDFNGAGDLFLVQLVGDVVKILSWLYAFPMLSRGAAKWFVASEVFFSLTLMFFVYLLVPYYGTHGANMAYLINYIFYLAFVMSNLRRICGKFNRA
ncbi:O-antigen translocase [Aeromonas veronii]|uniref:O-antigen translocase n=1 Tax=Aeromonas veronii TaxID=654 RepID=UPI00211DA38C|nr:O-antigen translocase [Aeromonas veronii]UUM70159.1 O-antigen translocase [Aeromonas veronii]